MIRNGKRSNVLTPLGNGHFLGIFATYLHLWLMHACALSPISAGFLASPGAHVRTKLSRWMEGVYLGVQLAAFDKVSLDYFN